jgi:Zn-finger nucleic acid-binding protein
VTVCFNCEGEGGRQACSGVALDNGPDTRAAYRDAGERGELVASCLRGGPRQLGQQRGFSHRGEADQRHAAITVLLHLEALAAAPPCLQHGNGSIPKWASLARRRLAAGRVWSVCPGHRGGVPPLAVPAAACAAWPAWPSRCRGGTWSTGNNSGPTTSGDLAEGA